MRKEHCLNNTALPKLEATYPTFNQTGKDFGNNATELGEGGGPHIQMRALARVWCLTET